MTWNDALETVLQTVHGELQGQRVEWVLMGSAATAVQGCRVIPGDLDILTRTPEGVYHFADLMARFAPDLADTENHHENPDWRSSQSMPVVAMDPDPKEAVWTFGRWFIDGFKVEVAHIEPPEDYLANKSPEAGLWEGGPEVWPYIRQFPFESWVIPVMPLEIQLETSLRRLASAQDSKDNDKMELRIAEILRVFTHNGYDDDLLKRCLSKKNQEIFADRMKSA